MGANTLDLSSKTGGSMIHRLFGPHASPRRQRPVLRSFLVGLALVFPLQPALANDTCGTSAEGLRTLGDIRAAERDAQAPDGYQAATSGQTELPLFTLLLELEGSGLTFSDEALSELPGLIYGTPSEEHPDGPPLSVAERFAVESYGQLAVTGIEDPVGSAEDLVGPFPVSSLSCLTPGETVQAVIDEYEDSVDWSPLEQGAQLLVLFPSAGDSGCAFAGLASIYPLNSDDFTEDDVKYPIALSLYSSPATMVHELGHTLGSGHAGLVDCEDEGWLDIPYVMNSYGFQGDAQCGTRAYGDRRSMMGNGQFPDRVLHSGAITKEAMGFLRTDEGAVHRVLPVTESGVYALVPLSEENEGGIKALKFPSGTRPEDGAMQYAYVEVRSPYNADGSMSADFEATTEDVLSQSNLFAGAHLSRTIDSWASLLVDGQPTSSDPPLMSVPFIPDFALPYTESYTDPLSGTEVTIGFPPTFGPVDVQIDIGRTDFTGPVIEDFHWTDHPDDPCSAIVAAHVEDASGLSTIALSARNVSAFVSEPLQIDVPLPGDDGWVAFEVDTQWFSHITQVSLEAWDDASSIGLGLAGDTSTTSDWVVLPRNPDCDTVAPQVTLISPEAGEEVGGVVTVQLDIVESESAIYSWFYTLLRDGVPIAFEVGLPEEPLTSLEVYAEHDLPIGDYTISYGAVDAYGNHFTDVLPFAVVPRTTFLRGDTNDDGLIDIADVTALMAYLYSGGSLACLDAADTNDDGQVNVADGVALTSYLYGVGSLPAPSRAVGEDPTDDALSCDGATP